MNKEYLPVYLSDIDEERFGIRTAKVSPLTLEILPEVMEFCTSNNVALLIARCSTLDLSVAQRIEREGFNLMDTLIYYTRDLVNKQIPVDINDIIIRPVQSGEEHIVKTIAEDSFKGYSGHYHADEKLDKAKCDEVYISWAYNSCISSNFADEVLMVNLNGSPVGFATLKIKNEKEGEGVLFGVAPFAQGRGVYRSLIIKGMEWCLSKDRSVMIVSTQIINTAVQKVWVRLGFEPSNSFYTFHKWFDY